MSGLTPYLTVAASLLSGYATLTRPTRIMKKICLTICLLIFLAIASFAQININTADGDKLATLPGICKVKAEAIIEHRQEYGDFKTVKDLTKVKGIGNKTMEKIKDDITIEPEE